MHPPLSLQLLLSGKKDLPGVSSILFIKTSEADGSLRILESVRNRYPEARITILCMNNDHDSAEILANGDFFEVLSFDNNLKGFLREKRRELSQRNIDLKVFALPPRQMYRKLKFAAFLIPTKACIICDETTGNAVVFSTGGLLFPLAFPKLVLSSLLGVGPTEFSRHLILQGLRAAAFPIILLSLAVYAIRLYVGKR